MPVTAKKIGVVVYFDPEIYFQIENKRNPRMSKSCFYSMALEEAFGITRPNKA